MLVQEVDDEIPCVFVIGRVYGHLPDEIDDSGMIEDDGSDSVPEVVHREYGLGAGLGTLVFRSDE